MLKQFVAFITLISLSFSYTLGNTFAEDSSSDSSQKIIELFGEKSGNTLLQKIDTFIKKNSTSEGNMLKLLMKLQEKHTLLSKKETRSQAEEKTLGIINYILVHTQEKLQEKFDIKSIGNNLSSEEKLQIESNILALQKSFISTFAKNQTMQKDGSEVSGSFKANARVDWGFIGTFVGSAELTDMLVKMQGTDSDVSGNLKLQVTNSGSISSLKTNLQVIQKDGEQFMKIQNLSSTGSQDNLIGTIAKGFEMMQQQDTFIKTTSSSQASSAQIVKDVQSILPIYLEKLQTKALFTPYKKFGTATLLIPSKTLCGLMKSTETMTWEDCTDTEYAYALEQYTAMGITLITEKKGDMDNYTILGNTEKANIFGKMGIRGDMIEKLSFDIIPNQTSYPDEGISLSYNGTEFNAKGKAGGSMFGIKLTGDRKNFTGNYVIAVVGQGPIQGTIQGENVDEKNGSIDLHLDGKDIASEGDVLTGHMRVQVSNLTKVVFTMSGSYSQNGKELIGGDINYDVNVTQGKGDKILAPTKWIEMSDIPTSTGSTGE